jgi:Nucleotidyl transferase AbiEii toxin, Type IV TA system
MTDNCYAIIGGAACTVLGSSRLTSDVDFVVPRGDTKAARSLLKAQDVWFEVEKRTNHTYYKGSPRIKIEILSPPALFRQSFTPFTPTIIVNEVRVLKPTLLLNTKCSSIFGRSRDEKRNTDAADIKFLLQWCTRHQMYPTAEEVPITTKDFVQYFTSHFDDAELWTNAGYDLVRGACLRPFLRQQLID